jgi:hypothetical protein
MTIDPDRRVKLMEVGTVVIKRQSKGTTRPVRTEASASPGTIFNASEGLLASQSSDDLSLLAQTKPAPSRQPEPPVSSPSEDETERTDQAAYGDLLTKEYIPSRAKAEPEPVPEPEGPPPEAPVRSGVGRTAARAMALGLVLAAPFYLWVGLVTKADSPPVSEFLQAFGEMVEEFIIAILGG